MRPAVDSTRLRAFLQELSRAAREPTRLYLTGGASQLLRGLRDATLDIDPTFAPSSPRFKPNCFDIRRSMPTSLITAVDRLAGVDNA